jgi:hypothetical protein
MNNVLSHIADISNLPWPAIIAIAGGMLIAIVAIVGGLITANRRQAMWHETARIALEKGQPLPRLPEDEEPAPSATRSVRDGRNDIRSGLIMMGVGAGLYLFLGKFINDNLGLVGAIPGFIGAALFVFGLISLSFKDKTTPPPSDRT